MIEEPSPARSGHEHSDRKLDVIVLGGGSEGTSGAFAAGLFVPSKTLRESALLLNRWGARKMLGVDIQVRSRGAAT